MFHYKKIDFNNGETYRYKLLQKVIFVTGRDLGKWELYTPDNTIVAKCFGSVVVVFPNYMWDGTTVIGDYYEDDVTLKASLIHDVLYNAKKNPNDVKLPFTLWEADSILADYLSIGYRKKKSFFKKLLTPFIYKWGLWTLGIPWKFGNNKYYILQKNQE